MMRQLATRQSKAALIVKLILKYLLLSRKDYIANNLDAEVKLSLASFTFIIVLELTYLLGKGWRGSPLWLELLTGKVFKSGKMERSLWLLFR